jgi:hypothetical protein
MPRPLLPRPLLATLLLAALLLPAPPASAFSDAELVEGFMKTVFGLEGQRWTWQRNVVKRFEHPVLAYVDNRAARDRRAEVRRFLRGLPARIAGLDLRVVDRPEQANFRVLVVDRHQYDAVVRGEVTGGHGAAPGSCVVRVLSGAGGITRADAVIVSDEGEGLFHRCMAEEILQGLGPLNDSPDLPHSVFNDRSTATGFTAFDRYILNMLYDRRLRSGMRPVDVRPLLPAILADTRRRLQ